MRCSEEECIHQINSTALLEFFNLLIVFIGIDDLFDVMSPVIARWKHIGLALRLDPSKLDEIEKENKELCLTKVLTLWLKRTYNTERFGKPSWKLLADAVHHHAGGNNPALALKITKNMEVLALNKCIISFHSYNVIVYTYSSGCHKLNHREHYYMESLLQPI